MKKHGISDKKNDNVVYVNLIKYFNKIYFYKCHIYFYYCYYCVEQMQIFINIRYNNMEENLILLNMEVTQRLFSVDFIPYAF